MSDTCSNCGEGNDRPGCDVCSACDHIECPVCGEYTLLWATHVECTNGCTLVSHSWGTLCLGDACGCDTQDEDEPPLEAGQGGNHGI